MTKNTKTLLWVAGLGAVAYYYWMKNKKAKVVAAPATTNFTGDLGVPEYQNAYGVKIRPRYGTTWAQNEFAATHQNVPAWATAGPANFTGDLGVPQYQNAAGVPKFGKPAAYPSSQNQLGRKLSGY